jgi:hypothetical protein
MMDEDMARLAAVAAVYKQRYHDCNPEVGMGPFFHTTVERVLAEVPLPFLGEHVEQIERQARAMYPEFFNAYGEWER